MFLDHILFELSCKTHTHTHTFTLCTICCYIQFEKGSENVPVEFEIALVKNPITNIILDLYDNLICPTRIKPVEIPTGVSTSTIFNPTGF